MIQDKLAMLDDGATITGGTTVGSVDVVDASAVVRNLGTGRPLYLVIAVTAVSGGDGSDTFTFALVDNNDADSTTSPRDVAVSATITGVANIPAGTKIVIPVPPGFAFQRYIGVRYAVTSDAVLTVDAFLTDDQTYDHAVYPDNTEGVTV
jgi:hypothetical protein